LKLKDVEDLRVKTEFDEENLYESIEHGYRLKEEQTELQARL